MHTLDLGRLITGAVHAAEFCELILEGDELRRRQLDVAWQQAAQYPGTAPETVSRLLAAEAGAAIGCITRNRRITLAIVSRGYGMREIV